MFRHIERWIAGLVFLSGLLNIGSALHWHVVSRLATFTEDAPFQISLPSRTLALIAGFFLLFVARGLWQRKQRAWWLSTVILTMSSVAHLIKDIDIGAALSLVLPLAFLIFYRHEFTVLSGRPRLVASVRTAGLIIILLAVYTGLGSLVFRHHFHERPTPVEVVENYLSVIFGIGPSDLTPTSRAARWFEDSIGIVALVAYLGIFAVLFSPAVFRRSLSDEERRRLRQLLLDHGNNSSSYLALMPDKQYFFNARRDCCLAYRISNGVAVVLGDPIGPLSSWATTISSFESQLNRHGLTVAFLSVEADHERLFSRLGYHLLQIGEEALVPTENFSLVGKARDDIRHSLNRMAREGITFQFYQLDRLPHLVREELDQLHRRWTDGQKNTHMSFSVNFFPLPLEPFGWLEVVRNSAGVMLGALSWLPFLSRQGLSLELMMRAKSSPNGLIEAAIGSSISFFQSHGIRELSLGVAPLATMAASDQRSSLNKVTDYIFENADRFYGYRSLFTFKQKFVPVWKPRYLAYRNTADLPAVGLALVRVHIQQFSLWSYLK